MQPVYREKGQQVLTSNALDKFSAKSPKNAHLPPGPGPRQPSWLGTGKGERGAHQDFGARILTRAN